MGATASSAATSRTGCAAIDPTQLIGGSGSDRIDGGFSNDFIVGDAANKGGNATGAVGHDHLDGDFGNDYIVGDNFSRFSARGGKHDALLGQKGNDTIIGDSAVTGHGSARGGGNDHFESMSDKDFEVGDSFSPGRESGRRRQGRAQRRAAARLIVGDSFTRTGLAVGAGRDQIHARPGPDVGLRRQPRRPPAGPRQGRQARLHRRCWRDRPPVWRPRPRHVQRGARTRDTATPMRVRARGPLDGSRRLPAARRARG